jgi:predicted phage-related endonuclease
MLMLESQTIEVTQWNCVWEEWHMPSQQFKSRRSFIGGSDARIIMGTDEKALVRLWREKRSEAEPEDLSGNLLVQLGTATEELNRTWYERNTGRRVTAVQHRVKHSALPWMVATLDRGGGCREVHGPGAA